MKKLVLTSLLAVFAVSGAHAANVINDNPLYRPMKGHFYSETMVVSHTDNANVLGLNEEFGYGVTDRLAVALNTTVAEADWFDMSSWNDFSFGLNYRAIDMGPWKADVFGAYTVNSILPDHGSFLDKDATWYTWTLGARGGYVGDGWTVAGYAAFDYMNSESFNWDDEGLHKMRFGVDGFLALNDVWGLVAGVEYNADYDNWSDNQGYWTATFGANLNIDETKFVGAYISKEMAHNGTAGKWEVEDGFGFGMKFGIDF